MQALVQKQSNQFHKILKLFLLYFLWQTALGVLHKHTEINLHFHPENLITKDHTNTPEKDCAVCPTILASSIFLIYKTSFFSANEINCFETIFHKPNYLCSDLVGKKLGRDPPLS